MFKMLSKALHNFNLWCNYNDTYFTIKKNKHMNHAMKDDPGVKFMRHGWWIVFGIIGALALYGRM